MSLVFKTRPGQYLWRFSESLGRLIRLLEEKAKSSGLSGQLYLDHLTYALALRLLSAAKKTEDGHIYNVYTLLGRKT